jgi:hypothetical protein
MSARNFLADLRMSEGPDAVALFDWAYVEFADALGGLADIVRLGDHMDAQRKGIDVLLVLRNGTTVRLDEKIRGAGRTAVDVALEVSHSHGKPGWLVKDLDIDYIAFGWLASDEVWLLPWPSLRTAWGRAREKWSRLADAGSEGFRWIESHNDAGYATRSIVVPADALTAAVGKAFYYRRPAAHRAAK